MATTSETTYPADNHKYIITPISLVSKSKTHWGIQIENIEYNVSECQPMMLTLQSQGPSLDTLPARGAS